MDERWPPGWLIAFKERHLRVAARPRACSDLQWRVTSRSPAPRQDQDSRIARPVTFSASNLRSVFIAAAASPSSFSAEPPVARVVLLLLTRRHGRLFFAYQSPQATSLVAARLSDSIEQTLSVCQRFRLALPCVNGNSARWQRRMTRQRPAPARLSSFSS